MKIALVPGSFSPPTSGHLEIIKSAARVFDKVVVAAMVNPEKSYDFYPEEIVCMLQKLTVGIENVTVDYYDGMLCEYVKDNGICAIVKGIRTKADLDYEMPMAEYNKIHSGADTFYVCSSKENADISSTLVKNTALSGKSIKGMVPECIEEMILKKYKG